MRQLQQEHREWVGRKYPGQVPKIPAVGCLEEAGELVHAILKMEQVRVWGEDSRHKLATLRVKLVDALGDCGVYACSLCNANEWDFAAAWDVDEMFVQANVVDEAIYLVSYATRVALEPTDFNGLRFYVAQLKAVAGLLGIDLDTAVRTTWETVKCR